MKSKRENWSIKNNGEQNEDHAMERRALYTITLKFVFLGKGEGLGERLSKAVISSASVKGKVPALENSTSLDNKPDSQPGSEFGTSPSLTFKEVH